MTRYADNSRALFDYEVLEHFTAGIEFLGTEVKSVREGKMNLRGAFVAVRGNLPRSSGGEAYLIGAGNTPPQKKKPLKKKKEIKKKKKGGGKKGFPIPPFVGFWGGWFFG